MTKKQALRGVAENMTLGIALRPIQIRGLMVDSDGGSGACAIGTFRIGQGLDPWEPMEPPTGAWEISEALFERFGGSIMFCNDMLEIEREAMVQVACEGAGLA